MSFEGIVLLILGLAVLGFLVYLITTKIPMSDLFKQTLEVVCVVAVVLYLLALVFGHAQLPTLSNRIG